MPPPRDVDAPLLATDLHVEATYRLTEALVEAENRMRRRVELLSEVVFETDAAGRLVFLNAAWAQALGQPLKGSLGRHLCDFVFEPDWPACERAMAGLALSGRGGRSLIRMRRQDGSPAWMEMSIARLPAGGAVGALHDVTDQKVAQDELAKLSLVASYTDNLVIITDREGRTEWVNEAFVRKTGYTLAETVGRKPGDLLQGPGTDREMVDRIGVWLGDGRSFKAELLNYTKQGEPYWVLFQITPIRNADGEVERFISIQTDSTELRRTQQELEAAKVRAETANEAKTQFLATISHEMRTPLNAILGSTDIALDEDGGMPAMRGHLSRINDSAEALLRLISDMLDVSKIEAGQFDVERIPVKIRACLNSAAAPAGDRARAKGLDFRLMIDESLPAYMLGDPDRLRQIVTNLAENAVKFTDAGFVRIDALLVDAQPGAPPSIEIRVVDSGEGIPEDVQPHIFDRFVQGDGSTTRRKGGAGLGLAIVKSLSEALGGTVRLSSRRGEGAEFRVTLPLAPVADTSVCLLSEARRTKAGAGVAVPRSGRVLVAEDTDANFAVLDIHLGKAGYTVARARNGREAVQVASAFDLILMDVEMPEMDGLEATRRIRADERARGARPVPILALTAHAVQGYRERCLSAGCTAYLSKPVRKPALLEAIAAALEDASEPAPVERSADDGAAGASIAIDPDLLQLVPEFMEYCSLERRRILEAIETGNWTEAARLGHGLKGAGPSLGFDMVGTHGLQIELAAKSADAGRIRAAVDDMADYLRRVRVVSA